MNEHSAEHCITLQEVMTNGITTVTARFTDCQSTSIVLHYNTIIIVVIIM